jgi:hypothetical protein
MAQRDDFDIFLDERMKRQTANFILFMLVSLLGIVFFIGLVWTAMALEPASQSSSDSSQPVRFLGIKEFEERFGVQIVLIAVAAGGDMVDLRFRVLNAEKARTVLQGGGASLALKVVDGDLTLLMPEGAMNTTRLQNGAEYYLLFGNPRGAIKPGTLIIVSIGDSYLEPMAAR